MQCQNCDKPATVHLTEVVNGQKLERHLCGSCAQKEGITVKAQVSLNDLLSNIVAAQEEAQELGDLACPHCGLRWLEFRKEGVLGCPHDYVAFRKPLQELLGRVQDGATRHIGRAPQRYGDKAAVNRIKLLRLRQDLDQAVVAEDYERAARLRDEIRQLG